MERFDDVALLARAMDLSSNFATKTASLQSEGLLNTRFMEMGVYFETDTEPQGWFILWEKTHA